MNNLVSHILFLSFIFTQLTCLKSYAVQTAQIKLQGETLNFELSGQKNWDYEISKENSQNQTKVVLKVKNLNSELGSTVVLEKNPFVKDIKIEKLKEEKMTVFEFILATKNTEAFDYLTDQPSKLILDFYKNETLAEPLQVKTQKKDVKKSKKEMTAALPEKTKSDRRPADVDYLKLNDIDGIETSFDSSVDIKSGLFDGGDTQFNRFRVKDFEIHQSAILKGLTNYYLHFPIIDQEFSFWKKMKENLPDYEIKPNNTDENKQARLLLTLYKKNRPLVLKKTFDWFLQKYPQSEYLEIAYLMVADSYFKLWKKDNNSVDFDISAFHYKRALELFPKSKLAERTSLFSGLMYIDRKNYLEASRRLNNHAENSEFKNRVSQEYAELGLAYNLSRLNQMEEALKIIQKLEIKTQDALVKAEAAFRKADIYMLNQKYPQALENYQLAMKKYGSMLPLFPNAYYNSMEALFRLEKPIEAHQAALKFVQSFPSHEYAPYALTRVGELLEIMGADQAKSTGAYLETHFRYGDNPRTIIARLHLLSTRMKSMKSQELVQTIQKMEELSLKSDLENVDQFKATMIADGYARRNQYDDAIKILTEFYQTAPTRKNSNQVTQRIVKNINDQIQFFSAKKEYKKSLQTYKKYSDTWLKKQDRIDTDYHIGKAYESAGAYQVGLQKYNSVLDRLDKLGTDERSLFIKANHALPLKSEVLLSKANCLFQENDFQAAQDFLDQIKNPSELSDENQIQRVHLAAQIYEKKENIESAIRYLSEVYRTWKNQPELMAPSAIKLAELEHKNNQSKKAIDLLKNLVSQKIPENNKTQALKKLAEISEKSQDFETAISALNQLLENEKSPALSEERYKLGELYYKQGELKKAETAWSQFTGEESQFWNKLASEKMNSHKWKDDYKKYLKRIPATARQFEGE